MGRINAKSAKLVLFDLRSFEMFMEYSGGRRTDPWGSPATMSKITDMIFPKEMLHK